ncbi:hypothetical protein ACJRO7_036339 [Eucalyptus globulus]|uniref:Uncharacterized protein n=1 Tax=Eucalyptus globulus TaxID=34317 RepID=A0ABD3IJG3_EUCGL
MATARKNSPRVRRFPQSTLKNFTSTIARLAYLERKRGSEFADSLWRFFARFLRSEIEAKRAGSSIYCAGPRTDGNEEGETRPRRKFASLALWGRESRQVLRT